MGSQAQQAFPDPDAASQARRTQAIRQCLMQNGLATRGATVPTPKVPGAGGTP
jgi:hypothetical protein